MDHGGQFEREGRVMSQVPVGGVDLCDNLPSPEALTAQTRNLNETNVLTQNQSLSPPKEEGGGLRLHPKPLFNNNGKDEEDEDIDEVMKEEEEEESEESSLIRCQSPDTPMTDSSFSETGSLLETPYPFSPGTSPEPTSPVIPVISPETTYPISPVDPHMFNTGSVVTTGPIASTTVTVTSDGAGPTCITDAADKRINQTDSTTEHCTSSADPVTSTTDTCTVASCPVGAAAATTGATTSNWEHTTSAPVSTSFSFSTCAAGFVPTSALLESLEQLAQRGDDTHLPHHLHQIAEAFVLHEDYQRALWCIQLERIYHQRVLDNLNKLQEQWETQCEQTLSDQTTQHLDTLKHICQTHSRPRASDAVCVSQDILRSTFEEVAVLPSCTPGHQVDGGMEQRASSSSHPQSGRPVVASVNLAATLNSPEISENSREDPDRKLDGADGFHGSRLTYEQDGSREGGEAEGGAGRTISHAGNSLHPSTAGEMDRSKPAEQQGGDLGPAEGKEAIREEEQRDVEEAEEALEMEDEGEEEEEEKQKKREKDSVICQKSLQVETLISGAEVEEQLLHQEAPDDEKLLETQAQSPQDGVKQQEQLEAEEEEYEYEVEQTDIIREAASLDDMAKLITVEEIAPASGLVSILKKRKVHVSDMSVSTSSEPRPEKPKPTAKRRVRFKVPEDDYEQDVGGSDSCLLLFLLCLVTVVISVGGTALYCSLGDAHSSVCQDFSRNADFYMGQIQRGIAHVQHWFAHGS